MFKRYFLVTLISLLYLLCMGGLFVLQYKNDNQLTKLQALHVEINKIYTTSQELSSNLYKTLSKNFHDERTYYIQLRKLKDIATNLDDRLIALQALIHKKELQDLFMSDKATFEKINSVIDTYTSESVRIQSMLLNSEHAHQDIDYFNTQNIIFQPLTTKLMNDLIQIQVGNETHNLYLRNRLNWMKYVALGFTLFYVILMLLLYIRANRHFNIYNLYYQSKNELIMTQAHENFFIVNKKLLIVNCSIKDTILGTDAYILGTNFNHFIMGLIPPEDYERFKSYSDLFFDIRTTEQQLIANNPIRKLVLRRNSSLLDDPKATIDENKVYFEMDIRRLRRDRQIEEILIRITNITNEINYDRMISHQSKSDSLLEKVLEMILKNNEDNVRNYLMHAQRTLSAINSRLRLNSESDSAKDDYQNALTDIEELINSLRRNTFGIHFEPFERLIKEFTLMIDDMFQSRSLSGIDFLPVALKLEELMSMQQYVQQKFRLIGSIAKPKYN